MEGGRGGGGGRREVERGWRYGGRGGGGKGLEGM